MNDASNAGTVDWGADGRLKDGLKRTHRAVIHWFSWISLAAATASWVAFRLEGVEIEGIVWLFVLMPAVGCLLPVIGFALFAARHD